MARSRLSRGSDIWALRADGQVIAVIEVDADGTISELRGVANSESIAGHGSDLVEWVQQAGLKVAGDVTISLSDFLPASSRSPFKDAATLLREAEHDW